MSADSWGLIGIGATLIIALVSYLFRLNLTIKESSEGLKGEIRHLCESFKAEIHINAERRRTDEAWDHVHQEFILQSSKEHEAMIGALKGISKQLETDTRHKEKMLELLQEAVTILKSSAKPRSNRENGT